MRVSHGDAAVPQRDDCLWTNHGASCRIGALRIVEDDDPYKYREGGAMVISAKS